MTLPAEEPPRALAGPQGNSFGARLRHERKNRGIGLRELSRQVDVSASLVSQIELGRVMPSVKTLYAITTVLGMSLDDLLVNGEGAESANGTPSEGVGGGRASPESVPPVPAGPVQRADSRKSVSLASGVRWELLTAAPEPTVEFQRSIYAVGGESCPADALMRHGGQEYGIVETGTLGVTVGFETYELGPGDSISFDSTTPHRLFNIADVTTTAIWVVVGRRGDARFGPR